MTGVNQMDALELLIIAVAPPAWLNLRQRVNNCKTTASGYACAGP